MQQRDETEELRLTVRLPKPTAEALRRFAHEDRRSLNSELVWILSEYTEKRRTTEESGKASK